MEKQKNNGFLFGILLCIIVVLAVLFILYAKGIISFSEKENVTSKSIKLDDSKYYVYDAQYQANTKYQNYGKSLNGRTYTTHDGFDVVIVNNGVLYIEDLVVPYINIDTLDAKNANAKIKDLYDEYVGIFDGAASRYYDYVDKNGITDYALWDYPMLKYYAYENNNILSIVITYGVLGSDILHPEYFVYNFDLTNGKLLNYSQILDKFNLDASEATSLAVSKVTEYVNSSESYVSEFLSETEEALKNSINNGNVLCFVDGGGKINYIVQIYMNAGSGMYPQKITISK